MTRVKRKRSVKPIEFTIPEPLPAGRASLDSGTNRLSSTLGLSIQPPKDHESHWRLADIDTNYLDHYSPKELLDMLIDLSPDIAAAAWQFQRLCNPGWEVKAFVLGSENVIDKAAQDHINLFFETLRQLYGSADIVIGRYFMNGFLRGAICGELVLDADARQSVDLVAPDPFYILFNKIKQPPRGEVWQPGQWQDGKWVPLDIPTFRYLPIDPAPASPYGRSLASPALFTTIFILSLLHDIKRVVMQQGYKRMDITVDSEMAWDNFNNDPQGYASVSAYIRGAIDAVKNVYRRLQPDDAFIHTDLFKVDVPTGTVDLDSIGALDKLIERLEHQVTRALKSNGVVMDTSNNTNESDSNRKWEIFAAGIKSLQHLTENMLETLLGLSLRAVGLQARVQFRFAELRASEMLRDEQAQAMRTQNARSNYDHGYFSQDEAANYAVGHNAVEKEPRQTQAQKAELVKDDNSGNEDLSKDKTKDRQFPVPMLMPLAKLGSD